MGRLGLSGSVSTVRIRSPLGFVEVPKVTHARNDLDTPHIVAARPTGSVAWALFLRELVKKHEEDTRVLEGLFSRYQGVRKRVEEIE